MTAPATRYRVPSKAPRNWGALLEPRMGIMLHYDESASDDGAIEWMLFDERCRVSYNWLILDDGTVRDIAPVDNRAWHAGVCRPSDPERMPYKDANSAFYGIAVAAKHTEKATTLQFLCVLELCVALCKRHGWGPDDLHRITSHRAEAWPRGRKDDPDGAHGVVLDCEAVRAAVRARLIGQ